MIRLIIFLGLLGISFNSLSQYDGEGENEISRFRAGVMWFYTVLEHTALVERYEQMYVQLRELSVDLDLQRVMDSLVLSAATLVNASKANPRPKTNN